MSEKLLQKESEKKTHFSTDYSMQKQTEESISENKLNVKNLSAETILISTIIPIGITAFVVLVSVFLVNRQLKMELMILLGDREN